MNIENIPPCWRKALQKEFDKPYMRELSSFLKKEREIHEIYPPEEFIFNAFTSTPLKKVKVLILGQDPYHGKNQAHGLAFSVQKTVKIPPSLRNIYKEVASSCGTTIASHGNLHEWAQQGVLLLNTTLSVRKAEPLSHAKKGWETFTTEVINSVSNELKDVVFMLWGKPAHTKAPLINHEKHCVLTSSHPSPLSAYRGFLGCNHFALANDYLQKQGKPKINWAISE